jgi:hypothetical protein
MATPTHCPRGHEYDEKNTYWQGRANGHKTACCRTCQRARLKAKKGYHTAYMREWRASNGGRHRLTWTELRKRKKAWLEEYKSLNGCNRCDENHPACLDFHHRNPEDKTFNLSEAIARASLARIQVEVAKCDILCSNCHRKLHYEERKETH